MNKEKELLERYNIRPMKIGYRNKTKIIETDQGKYTLKVKKVCVHVCVHMHTFGGLRTANSVSEILFLHILSFSAVF